MSGDPRSSWDETFMSVAQVLAESRADCTRRKVGAVITVENRIVSAGYNGAPSGDPGCLSSGACPRGALSSNELSGYSSYDSGPGTCIALHAEQNAILYAHRDLRAATLYVWTSTGDEVTGEPCAGCWRMIRGAQIGRVVWRDAGAQREWVAA